MSKLSDLLEELRDIDEWSDDNEVITEDQKELANDLFEMVQELIENDLTEEYTSDNVLDHDFKKHCNNKSSYHSVFYDFKNKDKFRLYENKINSEVLNTPNIVTTLLDSDKVLKLFRKLFERNFSILFTVSCGFYNANGSVKIGINNSNSDRTTNYLGNTINIIIMTLKDKTISMYPVDIHRLETKFNNIIKKHSNNKEIEFKFNND